MTAARRIGILGGTFDPFHCGHMDLARVGERVLDLTRLYVVPANVPPHRPQPFASTFHRFAMVSLAVAGHMRWQASDLELRSNETSYTSTTLRRFHQEGYSSSELFFVIGADAFAEIATWRDYPAILDLAHFAVISRPGLPVSDLRRRLPDLSGRMAPSPTDALACANPMIILIEARTADVSSTTIRERIAAGGSLASLVPAPVQQHIEQHGLYTSRRPGRRLNDVREVRAAERLHGEN